MWGFLHNRMVYKVSFYGFQRVEGRVEPIYKLRKIPYPPYRAYHYRD